MSDVINVNQKDKIVLASNKVFAIILIIVVIAIIFVAYIGKSPSIPLSNEESRKELVSRGFSNWDGSHRSLESHIKSAMNDPKSYEHVSTVYWDRGDHLIVLTKFRGKNAFGATVLSEVRAKVGIDGDVLEIIDTK